MGGELALTFVQLVSSWPKGEAYVERERESTLLR